jgi:hypothetical protein
VIDIRYWAYTADGRQYAPEGGKNLAPRQHLRQTKQKPGGFAAVVKAVREYRTRYPAKAVTYFADMNCPSLRDGWAVLIGGGSLPNVKLPDQLATIIPTLLPADGVITSEQEWCLANATHNYVIYTEKIGQEIEATVPKVSASYRVHWVDSESGEMQADEDVAAGPLRLRAKTNVLWLELPNAK